MSPVSSNAPRAVFVTGATGFIGQSLLERLLGAGFETILCLARHPEKLRNMMDVHPAVRVVAGDIADPSTYESSLAGVDTVVHLAAATGGATERDLRVVNVEGTGRLLEACARQRVSRFIHLSSIAAVYPSLEDYPYGRAKRDAEVIIQGCRVPYVILRPTIVLGTQGGNWGVLRKLACLPLVPLFGGGRAVIQPVDVEDVARAIVILIEDRTFENVTLDLGGPETLTFKDFFRRIRKICGLERFLCIPIPIWPVRVLLSLLAKIAGNRVPVSPGQLSPFVCNGIAETNPLYERIRPEMAPLDTLLREIAGQSGARWGERPVLEQECRLYTRYLTGRAPDAYVIRKYVESNPAVLDGPEPITSMDRTLVRFAAGGALRTRIADAYARIFRPRGLLRRKLMMMLAILESSREFHRDFSTGGRGNLPVTLVRIALAVCAFGFFLLVGILLLTPRQLMAGSRGSAS